MDICESIFAPFEAADESTKTRILLWELLKAPKRFLSLKEGKVSSRGMQKIMLSRASGTFDEPAGDDDQEILSEDARNAARVERLVKGGALSRGSQACEQKPTTPPRGSEYPRQKPSP